MKQHRCNNCEAQKNRETLAQILMNSIHLQGERRINPPLRDKYNRYSVTGMAAATLTQAMWVCAEGQWRYFHTEWFYNQDVISLPGTRRFRQEWRVDGEKLRELEEHAGDGIISICPEDVFCVLGINTDVSQLHLKIREQELNEEQTRLIGRKAKYLNQMDFPAAARLLQEVPEILDACSCGETEE